MVKEQKTDIPFKAHHCQLMYNLYIVANLADMESSFCSVNNNNPQKMFMIESLDICRDEF